MSLYLACLPIKLSLSSDTRIVGKSTSNLQGVKKTNNRLEIERSSVSAPRAARWGLAPSADVEQAKKLGWM